MKNRIKGFIPENDQWIELNATKDQITTETIAKGQEIIIVIGESLNKEKIEEYIKKPAQLAIDEVIFVEYGGDHISSSPVLY